MPTPRKSFFGLPPPWQPGYAYPSYMQREDLARGALVTRQLPRGTYSRGTRAAFRSGYALPAYVKAEVVGQGAMVTYPLPRGTYAPEVGGMTAVGGDDIGDGGGAITQYGRQAARYLLGRARAVPAHQRTAALKLVLDHVDPGLYRKAELEASKAPAGPALARLEHGLAVAMSKGVRNELAAAGRSRRAPKEKSLLGLGCYGCAALLGDVMEELGAAGADHRGTTSNSTGTGTRTASGADSRATPRAAGDIIQFGPFSFGAQGQRIRVHSAAVLPPAWAKWFPDELRRLNEGTALPANIGLEKFFPGAWKATDKVNPLYTNGTRPIFKGTNPITGKAMGAFITLVPSAGGWIFEAWYRDIAPAEKSAWSSFWGKIATVAAKVVHAVGAAGKAVAGYVKDAAGALKNLGCQLVNSLPTDEVAAAGAATGPTGIAVAAGATIAQSVCAVPAVDIPVIAPLAPPMSIPIIPIAIAAGAAYFLLR